MQSNAISKLAYTGLNQELLQTVKTEKGYQANEWITFVQAKSIGRNVRKGEKGVCLVRVVEIQKRNKKGKVDEKTYLKRFTVFNIEQTDKAKDI